MNSRLGALEGLHVRLIHRGVRADLQEVAQAHGAAIHKVLGVPYISPNISGKSRNLPNADTHNYRLTVISEAFNSLISQYKKKV